LSYSRSGRPPIARLPISEPSLRQRLKLRERFPLFCQPYSAWKQQVNDVIPTDYCRFGAAIQGVRLVHGNERFSGTGSTSLTRSVADAVKLFVFF
jgi:hypothetical protein